MDAVNWGFVFESQFSAGVCGPRRVRLHRIGLDPQPRCRQLRLRVDDDDGRPVGVQRPLELACELVGGVHFGGAAPETCCQRSDIESWKIQGRHVWGVLQQCERLEHFIRLVAEHHEDDRQLVLRRGPNSLDGVLERAIADGGHDGPFNPTFPVAERQSDCSRNTPADAATTGGEEAAGPLGGQPLCQFGHRRPRCHRRSVDPGFPNTVVSTRVRSRS